MNILLGDTSASCVIHCPWIPPAQREDHCGRVNLSVISRKRQRGKSPRNESSCRVDLSIWTSAVGDDGFNGRSFRRVNAFQCAIPKWGAPAKLLGVFRALDEQAGVEFSWIVVAVTRKGRKHGIALLQCVESGLNLVDIFVVRDNPDQAIVLRGPVVLYAVSSSVGLVGRDGDISLDSGFGADSPQDSSTRYLVCNTDHDLEGVIVQLKPTEKSPRALRVRTIYADGKSQREWVLRDVENNSLHQISVSVRRNIAALAGADGTLYAFHLRTGKCLWRTKGQKELESPRSLTFHRDMIIIASHDCEALWGVRLSSPNSEGEQRRSPTLLFPEECPAVSSQEHGHFLAPWRDSVLLCNDMNGTYCTDCDFSSVNSTTDVNGLHDEHYMHTVIKNLERRLDAGVKRVTDAAGRQEDKVKMVEHVRSLLVEASGKKLTTRRSELFNGQLEQVLSLPERREPMRDISDDEAESMLHSDRITVNGSSLAQNTAQIVKVVRTLAGVDKSTRFIIVRVHFTVLDVGDEKDAMSGGRTLQLNVSFDRCMPAIWDVERRGSLRAGDKCWLRACAPVSTVVSNSAGYLNDISILVRVDAADGPSQHLASISLTDVLSSTIAPTGDEACEGNLLSFEQGVHAVAQGPEAHNLRRLNSRKDIGDSLTINTRENLAHVNFKITSVTELALAVAKLRAFIDDDVTLRSTSELSRTAFQTADLSLRALEAEIRAIRDSAEQRQTVAYDAQKLRQLLRIQMEVDDSIGIVEEQHLGTHPRVT